MPLPFIIGGIIAAGNAIAAAGVAAGAAVAGTAATVGAVAAGVTATDVAIGAGLVATGAAVGGAVGHSAGESDGYDKGYKAASEEYERKFHRQVEAFTRDLNKAKRERDEYKQLCKELLAKCEEYKRMGYSELADRAKDDYYRLCNAA